MVWSDVERVCAYAEAEKTIAGIRDSAMIRLMSDCLLRVPETVAVDVEDLQKSTPIVRSSKTDQEGRGVNLYICDITRRVIKRRAKDAGVEGFISGHSLRGGSAVSLAEVGASVLDMQVAGCWKSSHMPAHYAQAELAERSAMARFREEKRSK